MGHHARKVEAASGLYVRRMDNDEQLPAGKHTTWRIISLNEPVEGLAELHARDRSRVLNVDPDGSVSHPGWIVRSADGALHERGPDNG
jgi:hypothetical protein